jgi:hypothetical protein
LHQISNAPEVPDHQKFVQNGEFLPSGTFDWHLIELYFSSLTDDTTSGSFPPAKSAAVKFATFGLPKSQAKACDVLEINM